MKRLSMIIWFAILIQAATTLLAQPHYLGEFNIRNDNAKDAATGEC